MSLEPILQAIELTPAMLLRAEIYQQLEESGSKEYVLDRSWMRLGQLLAQFKKDECWRDTGYQSFETFMDELRKTHKRGRSQLWAYLSVAETLGPAIDSSTLEEIGISKAGVLKNALKKSEKKTLPQDLIDAAKRRLVTAKELRVMAAEAMNVEMKPDNGTWFDWGGSYLTPEDRKLFKEAVEVTLRVLDIQKHVPDHVQRKEVFLAWAQEFLGTHAAEVNGPAMTTTPAKLLPVGGADAKF